MTRFDLWILSTVGFKYTRSQKGQIFLCISIISFHQNVCTISDHNKANAQMLTTLWVYGCGILNFHVFVIKSIEPYRANMVFGLCMCACVELESIGCMYVNIRFTFIGNDIGSCVCMSKSCSNTRLAYTAIAIQMKIRKHKAHAHQRQHIHTCTPATSYTDQLLSNDTYHTSIEISLTKRSDGVLKNSTKTKSIHSALRYRIRCKLNQELKESNRVYYRITTIVQRK